MRTSTVRRFLRFLTRPTEPKGSVGWQAVNSYMLYGFLLAVLRPLKTPPYQEAKPWSRSLVLLGASEAGVMFAIGAAGGALTADRGRSASACTVRTNRSTPIAANASDETPATSNIRSGVFGLMLILHALIPHS